MYKRILVLFLCFCVGILLTGCYELYTVPESEQSISIATETQTEQENITEIKLETETEIETESTTELETELETTEPETQVFEIPEDEILPNSVEKDGSYTSPEDVAEYIHTFGTLPNNFITKKQAKALGWDSSKGNLWDVAPDKSIGGDYFGNYESLLPDGNYHECDVNYTGGYRGAERIIYSDNGSIYYTNDHYQSFTQLY
ncbi:MAG: ribonuclease [Oscillospiraceae bacterium]|nr:ribonuclease [Oscillospiraceae bacterium]